MSNPTDPEKTLQLMGLISKSPDISQRDLAQATGLSLGLVNLVLRRLVQKGHLKVSTLNRKKVHYLLTPSGFLQKAQHSYAAISATIKTYVRYERQLMQILNTLANQGNRRFAILGHNDVSDLLKMRLEGFGTAMVFRQIDEAGRIEPEEFALDCRADTLATPVPGINVLAALLEMDAGQMPETRQATRG